MAAHEVYDTLDIELHHGDGGEETLSYLLDAAEKEVLRRKMDGLCWKQTGMTLDEYSGGTWRRSNSADGTAM
jgi:hypothetical protein